MPDLARVRVVVAMAIATATTFWACTEPSEDNILPDASTPTTGDITFLLDVQAVADSYPQMQGEGPSDPRSIESIEWLSYCGQAFGFDATVVHSPGQPPTLFASVTAAQRDRWAQVQEACFSEAVGRGWVSPLPTTEDQLRADYLRLVAVNDCLAGIGYGTAAPSLEAFMEEGDWNVYENTPMGAELIVAPQAGTDLPELVALQLIIQETCPSWPSR